MKEKYNLETAGPEINEARDRKNRRPVGETPMDEEDEIINANDPQKRYVKIEDVADPHEDYLTYGEGVGEEEDDNKEFEFEKLSSDPSNNKFKANSEDGFNIKELNPENTGIIGAVSISAKDNTILVNREAEGPSGGGGIEKELSRKMVAKKYEKLEGAAIPYSRVKGRNNKIFIRTGDLGDRESHGSYNSKTEPLKKKQRGLRKLIRAFIKPGSN